jgi:hypothetical protein
MAWLAQESDADVRMRWACRKLKPMSDFRVHRPGPGRTAVHPPPGVSARRIRIQLHLDWIWTRPGLWSIARSDDVGRPFRLMSAGVALHGLDQPPTRGEVVASFAALPVVLRLAIGLTGDPHHCSHLQSVYPSSMGLMTQIERQNLVDELRDMAGAASTADVREALVRMAERYAVRAAPNRHAASRTCGIGNLFVAANGGGPGVPRNA